MPSVVERRHGSIETGGIHTINFRAFLSTVGGDLFAASGNGDMTQTGPLTVNGTTDLDAGSGDITLDNAENDFVGQVSADGVNIALTDKNNLQIGNVNASENLTIIAGQGNRFWNYLSV